MDIGLRACRRLERGMTTAEYATGALCTGVIACGMAALVDSGWFVRLFEQLFDAALIRTLPELLGWFP